MKKTLLATALAVGFAGAAGAQTSVTLYGFADVGVGYTQYKVKNQTPGLSDKATRTGLYDGNNSGSRWGLRGTEDLGDGLRATFWLESGYRLSDGTAGQNGGMFSREAALGLQSDSWGHVRFGRQTNFASLYYVGTPNGDGFGVSGALGAFTSMGTVRMDNMITYETPSFSGFQLGVGYSFQDNGAQLWDVNNTPDTDQSAITAGLRYINGPLTVAASYDVLHKNDSNPNGWVGGEKDVKSWVLSGSYDFDVVRLHLAVGQDKDGVRSPRAVPGALPGVVGQPAGYIPDGYKQNGYGGGLTIPLDGSSEVRLAWSTARLGSSLYKTNRLAAGGKSSENRYAAIYRYNFSNRTNMYAIANYATGYAFNDVNASQVIVGLRHMF